MVLRDDDAVLQHLPDPRNHDDVVLADGDTLNDDPCLQHDMLLAAHRRNFATLSDAAILDTSLRTR